MKALSLALFALSLLAAAAPREGVNFKVYAAGKTAAGGAHAAYFDRIERLLVRAKVAYAAGQADAAGEALIGAYLDNFEYLERPLGAANKRLEGKLETALRDQLRGLLKQKASPAKFNAAVDAARTDLARARAALK